MTRIQHTAHLAALVALALAGCSQSSPPPTDDCEISGTCDTPDMTANAQCEMLCDGLDNEPDELGEGDRLSEYEVLEHDDLVESASGVIRHKKKRDPEDFDNIIDFERADYEALEDAELAQFVCQSDCREQAAIGFCEERRHDAVEVTQTAFKRDFLRWACADVDGVTFTSDGDSRGQEYCEYFAVVQLPGMEEAVALGQNIEGEGQTPQSVSWSIDQDFDMEDEELGNNGVVGQCVFTTWHSDIEVPLPVCAGGDCPFTYAEEQVRAPWVDQDTGLALDAENMKMKVSFNSNRAAADLVEKCISNPIGAEDYPYAKLADSYVRGCMGAYALFQTEWRRSDSEVCVVGTRLAECGCKVEVLDDEGAVIAEITDPLEVGDAVVPPQWEWDDEAGGWAWKENLSLRGFQLGTWSGVDQLPPGCRIIETGDTFPSGVAQRNIVACDIRTADLRAMATAESSPADLGSEERLVAKDVKEFCRAKYGNDVVVHVPIPAPDSDFQHLPIPNARVTCDEACGEDPWVVEAD